MARKNPAAVPVKEYFGKYADDVLAGIKKRERRSSITNAAAYAGSLADGDDERGDLVSTTQLWDAVRQWWPIRLMRAAAGENDTENYKRLLQFLLLELHVPPPKGVLVPVRWKVGRPRETENTHAAWVAMGKPALDRRTVDRLAKMCYGDQYSKALSDGKLRKNLRDRVRNTIGRYEPEISARKPHRVS